MVNDHQKITLGVLINNLGTPASSEISDVKKFLKAFLWDPRVIKMPRLIWWLILNVIILNIRPKQSAAAYKKIWTSAGSPLLSMTQKLSDRVRDSLNQASDKIFVEVGMRYGSPSIEQGLNKLKQAGANIILIFPLYPQYSYTTTASVEDEVARILGKDALENPTINKNYFDNPEYIKALANSVKKDWNKNGQADILLMSFHGIPKQYADDGDPYQSECIQTAHMLAEALELESDKWQVSFQSRLGPKKWLEPYTDKTLQELAMTGTESVQVICPGFSVDCLETLEEIAIENRTVFLNAGGKDYHYIPCLNDSNDHIKMITNQILHQFK